MKLDTITGKLRRFEALFSTFPDVIDSQALEIRESRGPRRASEVEHEVHALQDGERLLKVGIIGRVKAGKSSLINALLFEGRDVLPKAATPMTAALTSIRHAEQFEAEVELFSAEDIKHLKAEAKHFLGLLHERVKQAGEDAQRREKEAQQSGRPYKAPALQTLQRAAERELEKEQPGLKAAHDICQRMSRHSGPGPGEDRRKLTAENLAQLRVELETYVGASGAMMPFTKTLHIGLPVPSLTDLQIIDTPGLNDPVVSREQRTEAMLMECAIVLIVSPAGQFLNAQDLDLADRIQRRDGIQEIYVVASQADMQLHSNLVRESDGKLDNALKSLADLLGEQADKALGGSGIEVLRNIARAGTQRVLLSSAIARTLLDQPESEWDEGARHALSALQRNYPSEFASNESRKQTLAKLSGHQQIADVVAEVSSRKDQILAERVSSLLQAQQQSLGDAISRISEHVSQLRDQVASTELGQASESLTHLRGLREKGELAASNAFADSVEELERKLSSDLKSAIKEMTRQIQDDVEESRDTDTVSYQHKAPGVGAWVKRLVGAGGHESGTRTIDTLSGTRVRRALLELRDFVTSGCEEAAVHIVHSWRQELVTQLIQRLRLVIGDERLDVEQLRAVCRRLVARLSDIEFPEPPPLPDDLATSSKLRGSDVEKHLQKAEDYLEALLQHARNGTKSVVREARALKKLPVGRELLDDLESECSQLEAMVKNKRLTMEKIDRLLSELGEIAE